MNEDELIPFFEKCRRIWELRLIMDPLTNLHRGFAFVTFASPEAAQAAVSQVINSRLPVNMKVFISASICCAF